MRENVKKISITALFAALILIATSYIKIPISMGYVHAGDVFIIICCFFLPFYLSVPCVAVASMFADLFAGYAPYMLVTLLAKALLAAFCRAGLYEKIPKLWKMIVFPGIGSILMIAIYFVFEGFYYGWAAAIANIPSQFIQPGVGISVAIIAIFAFTKIPYLMNFRSTMSGETKKKNVSEIISVKLDDEKTPKNNAVDFNDLDAKDLGEIGFNHLDAKDLDEVGFNDLDAKDLDEVDYNDLDAKDLDEKP